MKSATITIVDLEDFKKLNSFKLSMGREGENNLIVGYLAEHIDEYDITPFTGYALYKKKQPISSID